MPFDDETTDVLIGGYLSAEAAHQDYEAVLGCGARLWGAVVVSKDLEGNVSLEQTDHTVEEGAAGLAGVGFVVGLFAPPLLAATAIGAAVGAVSGKALHKKIGSQVEKMAEETIPIGGAGLIVAYPALAGRESRARGDSRHPKGDRRSRGSPRESPQGRPRRRPEEDGPKEPRSRAGDRRRITCGATAPLTRALATRCLHEPAATSAFPDDGETA